MNIMYIEYLLYRKHTHSIHKELTQYNEYLLYATSTYSLQQLFTLKTDTYSMQRVFTLCNEYLF